jgi:ABC-type Fe3+-hydroxamate transport system substrate-binding protein
MTILTSIHGRRLGLTDKGNLEGNGLQITSPCVDATVTVGDESANVRAITIQLKDANGNDINYVETVEIIVFLNAAQTAFVVTGGSTGIAIGTDGALLAVVAKKYFLATSEADGDIDLTWTDTGTEAAFIGVRLPNGRIVMGSQALTNA